MVIIVVLPTEPIKSVHESVSVACVGQGLKRCSIGQRMSEEWVLISKESDSNYMTRFMKFSPLSPAHH